MNATKSHDHREDIFSSAQYHTDLLSDPDEPLEFLDVEVWKRENYPELSKVEFILTLGGPTVSVLVDENDHVTYSHSWGMNPRSGDDLKEIRLHDDLASIWIDQAEMYRE